MARKIRFALCIILLLIGSSLGTTGRNVLLAENLYTTPSNSFNTSPVKKRKISASHEKPVAQIVSVRKQVDLKKAGDTEWKQAGNKATLVPSDQIRTGKKSVARVKMHDGTTVLLLQNSAAEMENLSTVQKTIKLLKGKVRAIVKSLKNPGAFQIKTPVGVASVRGTEFEVEFDEDSKQMAVDVLQGEVGVSRLGDLAQEVILQPGERLQFGAEGEMGSPLKQGALPITTQDVRVEMQNDQVKQSILATAAEEERIADYQTGKSLIDVDGKRVRVEEYIMRPAPNKFKLVSLNERSNRFDYFTYTGTFNQNLPVDLSVALKHTGGKLGVDAPDYYLTGYETLLSNTKDNITDSATDGHLVKISYDGSQYTLTDNTNGLNTRTVDAKTLQADGSWKIYDPVHDSFSLVTADQLTNATKFSVLDNQTGAYRDLTSGDILWKTRFNSYSYYINNTLKTSYAAKSGVTNTLAVDLDATFSQQPIATISENPSGDNLLHNKLSLYYQDGSLTTYDNYIIDDKGQIAGTDSFSGLSNSAAYQNELVKWNYQQKVKSTEMSDEIDLVIDPRIGTMSGLIQ